MRFGDRSSADAAALGCACPSHTRRDSSATRSEEAFAPPKTVTARETRYTSTGSVLVSEFVTAVARRVDKWGFRPPNGTLLVLAVKRRAKNHSHVE